MENLKSDPCADKPVEQQDCWSQTAGLECVVCGVFFLSEANLNDHMKRNHKLTLESPTQTSTPSMISKFQQTIEIKKTVENKEEEMSDKFEKYPCFYCDKEIVSRLQAIEHRIDCHGATDTPSMFSFPVRLKPMLFKCILCGLVASCETDIVEHKKSMHGSQ